MVLAIIFLKEKFTIQKLIALILAFAGCILVSGFGGKVTVMGILVGLGSGLGYGLYSIFGFMENGRRVKYYGDEDAVMMLRIGDPGDADPAMKS